MWLIKKVKNTNGTTEYAVGYYTPMGDFYTHISYVGMVFAEEKVHYLNGGK